MTSDQQFPLNEFKEWIRSIGHEGYILEETDECHWCLKTEYAEGRIVFHEMDIIELMIVRVKDEETIFYLHFQLHDAQHAQNLYEEMVRTLLDVPNRLKVKVLLTCTSGLTTGYFAMKLNEAAENLRLDYEFKAVPFSKIFECGFEYDVVLLAPQVHYEYDHVRSIFRSQSVIKIPAAVFAQYRSGDLIETIMEALREKRTADPEAEAIRSVFDNEKRILCIGLINHHDSYRIGYCIYDHGRRTLDKEVIKETHSFVDIEDLLDYVLTRHSNIDAVAIAYPGISYRGCLHMPEYGLSRDFNMGRYLEEKYGHKVILINDVNAMALGYYAMHENCENMVFYFQPRGNYKAGAGVIIDGGLHRGALSAAGEIDRLIKAVVDEPEKKIFEPEGALEIVSKALLAFITTLAPEKLIVYSALTPDVSKIRDVLKEYIEEEFIPEIIWTDVLKTYILPGALIHALDVLKRLERDPLYYKHLEENNN